jgi:CheY-like chemotaxis protein
MGAAEPASSRSILLVEDDLDLREALSMVLEAEGYRIVGAANGLEALTQLRRSGPPCLILLDLMMPIMDGWQFRAEQQQDPALASIPVVVFSADGRVPEKARALGAVAYCRKPIDFDVLLETIRRYC